MVLEDGLSNEVFTIMEVDTPLRSVIKTGLYLFWGRMCSKTSQNLINICEDSGSFFGGRGYMMVRFKKGDQREYKK